MARKPVLKIKGKAYRNEKNEKERGGGKVKVKIFLIFLNIFCQIFVKWIIMEGNKIMI